MPEHDVIAAFPRRPLAVRPSWRDRAALWGGAAAVAAALGLAAYIGTSEALQIRQDERIWTEGRPVPVSGIQGRCRTNLLLASDCRLVVTYEPTPGRSVEGEVSGLIFGGLDSLPEPVAKVDPTDPNRIALNAMVETITARWIAVVEVTGLLFLVCATVAFGVWLGLREARLWRILARDPQPAAARVVRSRYVSTPNHAHEIRFEYPWAGGLRRARQRLAVLPVKRGTPPSLWRYREPILLDPAATRLLALTGPKGALLVPSDFRPLVLTEAETTWILSAASQAARG